MKKPQKIKIGFNTYKVEFKEEIDGDDEIHGQTHEDSKLIEIKKESPGFMASTLLHEIYHAMHSEIVGIRTGHVPISLATYYSEEELTAKDSLALSWIIRDNPEVFRWIVNNMGKT